MIETAMMSEHNCNENCNDNHMSMFLCLRPFPLRFAFFNQFKSKSFSWVLTIMFC